VEETSRVLRTYDHASVIGTFYYPKVDVAVKTHYREERYNTDDSIGAFLGQSLTYKDLNRHEFEGEIESAWKLWPKTAFLFSGLFGEVEHETGKKSDSTFYGILTGLRGKPTSKMTVEAKTGFRSQDYTDNVTDFNSLVFYGTIIEDFTTRDILRIDFTRTPQETTFANNAYYESSYLSTSYKHGFTESFFGLLDGSYELSDYPEHVTESGKTAIRKDNYWSAGAGLIYELPKGYKIDFKYSFRKNDSNFSAYEYKNNRFMLSLYGSF